MIGFIILFAPPLLFFLLSMPFLHAKNLHLFDFIETQQVKADPSDEGHVNGPCHFMRYGWVRCFLISLLLCCLGWIPAVIFDIGFVVHYGVCMCRHGF